MPPVAATELRRLLQRARQADLDAALYLRAITDTLGIDRADVQGFDDEKNELILRKSDD